MTARPRRYVRVEADDGSVKATCICRGFLGCRSLEWDPEAWASIRRAADHHARSCPAVRTAMERDYYAARLDQRDAFAARVEQERDQLRADRAAWRTIAIRLQADLIEAREERA